MRHLKLIVCMLASFLGIPSTLVGQYEPYPTTGGSFMPYADVVPASDNWILPENQPRNSPDDLRMEIGPLDSESWFQQTPRNSSFRLERPVSYSLEQTRPFARPTQDPDAAGQSRWGPPPDIHSNAAEGMRNPAPAQPQAEPAPPLNADPVNPPADEAEPVEPQPEPQNEFFEPNPDDLREGYIWYQPSTWEDFGWDSTIELGMNGSTGNARTNSLKAGFKAERETEIYKFLFDIVHNRASAGNVSTQNNVISKLRLDRKLHESRWSLFAQGMGVYDEFKDFDVRLVGNMGVNYKFIKTDTTTLAGDFGSGVSHEIGGPDDSYVPEALFGLDFEHQLSKRQKLYAKFDYFPDWVDWSSYRAVTDAGWELLLDEEWGLNLKIGVIDRYDSTPGSRKPNDLNYSMLLLWKL